MSTTTTIPEVAALAIPAIARIRTLASELEAIGKTALSKAIECGRLLSEAKEQLGHGAWLPWLADNFTFTPRTATNWMKVAEMHATGKLKSETVSDLSLSEVYRAPALCLPEIEPPGEDEPFQPMAYDGRFEPITNEESAACPAHHLLNMLPHLDGGTMARLSDSIKNNGQHAPIIALEDGRIIDGRARWIACQRLGIAPLIQVVEADGDGAAHEVFTACNFMRTDKTKSERAMAAATSWKMLRHEANPCDEYYQFAADHFTIPATEARMALLIVREAPQLIAEAQMGLIATFNRWDRERKNSAAAAYREKVKERQRLLVSDNPALEMLVRTGKITLADAANAIESRQ